MAWPELSKTIKAVDISWYQHDGTDQRRPFDVDLFCEKHPDVELALIRACWPSGKPDAHYPHYFDGFQRNGVKVAAYLWPNPIRPISQVTDNWVLPERHHHHGERERKHRAAAFFVARSCGNTVHKGDLVGRAYNGPRLVQGYALSPGALCLLHLRQTDRQVAGGVFI